MAKIYGEAVENKESGKWGFYLKNEVDDVLLEPIYTFDTRKEAEQELVKALRKLDDIAQKG